METDGSVKDGEKIFKKIEILIMKKWFENLELGNAKIVNEVRVKYYRQWIKVKIL